jgi:hypothetical protein
MGLETTSFTGFFQTIGSVGVGMIITIIATRKKNKAETLLAQAQTQFTSIEAYSIMLGDLRSQLNLQGDQLKNQAQQILNLQKKENEYVKIIKNDQIREKQYIAKIKELEIALKQADEMLNGLKIQLKVQEHEVN